MEFKNGDPVEVSDNEDFIPLYKGLFVGANPDPEKTSAPFMVMVSGCCYHASPFKYCRKPNPYADFKKDDLVWAWDNNINNRRIRFFASVGDSGLPYVFISGFNSEQTKNTISYKHVEKYEGICK